jgi:hypothetical protein
LVGCPPPTPGRKRYLVQNYARLSLGTTLAKKQPSSQTKKKELFKITKEPYKYWCPHVETGEHGRKSGIKIIA